jgi:hypothetical protein
MAQQKGQPMAALFITSVLANTRCLTLYGKIEPYLKIFLAGKIGRNVNDHP